MPRRTRRRGAVLVAASLAILPASPSAATGACAEPRRTPEPAFAELRDYPYQPHYVRVSPCGLRMHYVDVGPREGRVVLLAHGNPAWSYMYRNWIPRLTARGYRVIAPDMIGFGKSDKLGYDEQTYRRQVRWMRSFVRALDLRDITLYAQDWGGLIFLRVAAAEPERFGRIAVSNTALPTAGEGYSEAFRTWQVVSQIVPSFGPIIDDGTARNLSPAEIAAYDAPWPTPALQEGPRALPWQVPDIWRTEEIAANIRARAFLRSWTKPFLVLWSAEDTITTGWDRIFLREVPGARGLPHRTYPGSHFIQEDVPEALVQDVIDLAERG